MLNIKQIENIIKSKYEDLEIGNFFNNWHIFKFDFERDKEEDYTKWKTITLNIEERDKIFYEENKFSMDALHNYEKFAIENNAIELKHLLDIEITKQDMIDWVNNIDLHLKNYKKKGIDVYIVLSNTLNTSSLELEYHQVEHLYPANKDTKITIFTATNSQEYWRLYNIIKNLKE